MTNKSALPVTASATVSPARQIGWVNHDSCFGIERSRGTDSDPMNHASHSRVGVQQTVDHRGYGGQSFGRVPTGRHRSANLGKNSTIMIDDAGGDLRASNIDTDHQSMRYAGSAVLGSLVNMFVGNSLSEDT